MEISVMLKGHWVPIKRPLSIIKKHLKIAKEIGDRAGEGTADGNLGKAYNSLGRVTSEKLLNIMKNV